MRLRNKVVFVSDADSSSGKALLHGLAEEGAHFILNSSSGGATIGSELEQMDKAGSQVYLATINDSSSTEVNEMLEDAAAQLGTVDIFIHNNNTVTPAPIETCKENLFLESLRINAKSAFICTQAVGKQMIQKQSGKIVYISSIHAEKPTGSAFVYSIAKGAVKMLAKEAALFLGRHGINVNTIELCPIEGDHERFQSNLSTLYTDYEYKVPNAVLGSHEDLAELVLFLSSEQSRYLNGSDIRMDGGFLLHYMNFKMKRP